MNRRYGNAPLGEPAREVQRYASNDHFTINLLRSMQGIDYVNVIDGASNGFQLFLFFLRGSTKCHQGRRLGYSRARRHSYHGQLWIPSWTLHRTSLKRNVWGMWSTYFVPVSLFATFQYLRILLSANQSFLEPPSRTSRNQTEYSIFLACERIRNCGYILSFKLQRFSCPRVLYSFMYQSNIRLL